MSLISFDNWDGFIWLDGCLVPWRDARMHALIQSCTTETMYSKVNMCYAGPIFKLDEHNVRQGTSAQLLKFGLPYFVAELNRALPHEPLHASKQSYSSQAMV